MVQSSELHPAFQEKEYLFRRKFFKIFGGAFHVYDKQGNLQFYSEQKAFKLKEDVRIYSDEEQSQELLIITTPQILDVGATYYVTDGVTGEEVGGLRRKAIQSMFRDQWAFLDTEENETGRLIESSLISALLSRAIKLIPQSYRIELPDERQIAIIKQHFNPFILKYSLTITAADPPIDPRLLIASGVLLAAIEGRQQ